MPGRAQACALSDQDARKPARYRIDRLVRAAYPSRMRRFLFVVGLGTALTLTTNAAFADTLEVGPGKTYSKPSDAIKAAHAGDTIEIDASGSYDGDTVTWSTDNLTVRGVNGRPKINTAAPDGGKGIFTILATTATIENIEFSGAQSSDNNGAGIRHQGVSLTVRGCYFHDNQDGILGSPSDDQGASVHPGIGTVLVETSEFAHNGAGDGLSHNMYFGPYASFTLRFSYSHGAVQGHLVKSRAYRSFILYNRLTDEAGTEASYEVDLPNGGTSYVIGNSIEQSDLGNDNIVETGDEGATNPTQVIYLINNTIVNDHSNGTFLNVTGATATLVNNIFKGAGTITNAAGATMSNNWDDSKGDPMLVNAGSYDYHLAAGSPCIDQGKDPGAGPDMSLAPAFEYVHPENGEGRIVAGSAIDIGAYELGGAVPLGDGGIDSVDGGGRTGGGDPGGVPPNADGVPANGSSNDGGCGCVITPKSDDEVAWLVSLGVIAMTRRRARRAKSSK